MSEFEHHLSRRGLDLGKKREPLADVLKYLQSKVAVHKSSVSSIRAGRGRYSGQGVLTRLHCLEVQKDDSVLLKNEYMLDLCRVAKDSRTYRKTYGHKYQSEGYTDSVAENLEIDGQSVRKMYRLMRAEVVLQSMFCGESEVLLDKFKVTAGAFIEHYISHELNPPSLINQKVVNLERDWDGTIPGFYKSFYGAMSGRRSIGILLPYEVDFFESYFESRLDGGSALTAMDHFVLSRCSKGRNVDVLEAQIERHTSVPVGGLLWIYRGLGLLGKRDPKG